MANNTNNTQNKGFENIKVVKSAVVNVAKDLQQSLSKTKQRAQALSDAINAKKKAFAAADAVDESNVSTQVNEAQQAAEQTPAETIVSPSAPTRKTTAEQRAAKTTKKPQTMQQAASRTTKTTTTKPTIKTMSTRNRPQPSLPHLLQTSGKPQANP